MNNSNNQQKGSRFFKTSKNLVFQLLYQVIALILGLVLPWLIIRTYGSEVNGLTTTAKNIVTLVTLAKAGISTTVTFLLYKPVHDDNRPKIASIIRWSTKAFTVIGAIVLLAGIVTSLVFAVFQKSEIGILYVFIACFVLCFQTAIDVAFTSAENVYFNATQDKYLISIGLLLFTLVSYGFEFLVCIFKMPFVLLYFCGLVGCLLKIFYLKIVFKKRYKRHELLDGEEPDKEKIHVSGIVYSTLNEVAHSVVFAVQSIIISLFYGLAQSSVFSVYAMVINALSLVAQVFYTSFSPGYGSVVAEGNEDKINKVFNIFQYGYSFLVLVLFMPAAFLFMPFVGIYTKNVIDVDYNNVVLMVLFVVYGVLYSIRVPYNLTMSVNGLFKASGVQTGICALISIGMSVGFACIDYSLVLLGPIFFYASNTLFQHFYLRKALKYFDNDHFWNHIVMISIGVSSMVVFGLMFMNYYSPDSYLSLVIEAIIVVILSIIVIIVLSICFDRKWFFSSLSYLKSKIKKK